MSIQVNAQENTAILEEIFMSPSNTERASSEQSEAADCTGKCRTGSCR